ncbi:M15 family metallopeptidase [Cellulomonas sp. Leaf334]|uniref:M15 family metallopeptidase n=1 Tax=Cellulomonas sp. Leaf334 TaxID=1736339 RepID=UPI0006F47370|nr:M15 family metallopeptidase [Cellulomonas sp. Leaf334]KQR11851.1 hypothetical protein ASF78_11615 [Cellulomonas sp. Leaf334]
MTLYVGRLPERVRRRRARAAVIAAVATLCATAAFVVHLLGGLAANGADDLPPTPGSAAGLDPELQRRFDVARVAAAADGVELKLTSGWRSAAEQQSLVDGAVEKYGSLEEARRWVLPPESSAHVQGKAIDVGPTDGALWLEQHGLELGLCRTYANEMWHFEMLADGATACPEMHLDSSGGW